MQDLKKRCKADFKGRICKTSNETARGGEKTNPYRKKGGPGGGPCHAKVWFVKEAYKGNSGEGKRQGKKVVGKMTQSDKGWTKGLENHKHQSVKKRKAGRLLILVAARRGPQSV